MAWYPGATRMELQPESDSQHAIRPTQFIMHSIAAPWDEKRMYEYWRDSTNLESHFGLDYDGSIGQFIGTETRADANYRANERPDGTGAVSIETASNLKHTDAWTPEQMEQLIRLGVWLHQRHGIPLRICRTASDPGFGYHRLHSDWAVSGTDCPGDARVKQFREVVFPGIVARANGNTSPVEEEDMTPEQAKQLTNLDKRVSDLHKVLVPYMGWQYKGKGKVDAWALLNNLSAQITAQTAAIKALAGQLGDDVDTAAVVAAVEKAISDAVVKVSVDVTGPTNS
ncbi:N-acetylmuramoyl-L-alanine amidase [Streptomyces lateritius]|uniref:peptidoglycan recognition protein family protein n=1 Tax=Streptomyces lateritius TaxID=67313 RepID=UPI001C8CEAB4|nr:N-acetylmuramoyl-L-alanine amidase [Streptomyces lateritius]MBX9425420.1 N-acetylmuramoyl-L-alanine amidase [Streptomyces lateritius]